MANLALHHQTEQQLTNYQASPSHGLLLVGPTGSGKRAVADWLASSVLAVNDPAQSPYVRIITASDGNTIGVEAIRNLEHFLSLVVPGQQAIKRLVIIESAHTLTGEAQNALLKTLEEPPQDTVLLLTADSEQALLPTVRSRLQTISVKPPKMEDLQAALQAQGLSASFSEFAQAHRISGGLPGLTHALLSQADHPLTPAVAMARELLQQSSYERLVRVDELAKNKQLSLDTLTILQRMAHLSLQTADGAASKRWQIILTTSYKAHEALSNSGQPKLVLTDLLLAL